MKLKTDFDLKMLNTFGLSATAELALDLTSIDSASYAAETALERGLPLRILGGGSNVLLPPRLAGIVGLMKIGGIHATQTGGEETLVTAGAGVNWNDLVKWTLEQDLPGLENLAGIPGTVGAAPIQNIGAYGVELAERFDSLVALDTHLMSEHIFHRDECEFGYRNSWFKRNPGRYIILQVTLALPNDWRSVTAYAGLEGCEDASAVSIAKNIIRLRKDKLPDWTLCGNVGSFFHNPVVSRNRAAKLRSTFPELPVFPTSEDAAKLSAAWMIEQCGLKGAQTGAASVSEQHALVLVNRGGATTNDVAALSSYVRKSVFDRFGIELSQEPEWM